MWLLRREFRVPEAWVVMPAAFTASLRELPATCEPKALLRASGGASGSQRAAEARDALLQAPFPEGLRDEVEDLWLRVKDSSPWGLAVRSSATCEDGQLTSMAGLAETRLGVFGVDALCDAIRAVWASVASGRALAYLARHGVRDVSMAVVIQRMVEAEAAGVMFTSMQELGPEGASHAHDRIINVAFGLGSPVVEGIATPDMLRVDARGRLVGSVIARKSKEMIVAGGKLVDRVVTMPDAPALARDRIEELAAIAARLEKFDPRPWDVEFAIDKTSLWVLQARPVTGLGFPDGGDATTVWSNVNVGEALPGVATPLTWSVAGAFSEHGFRRAFSALGCSVPRHARLVGNVHGRFYLHLTNFMRIATQVPWLDARTLVELGGGGGGDELTVQSEEISRVGFYARLPLTASRLFREQLRLDVEVQRFETYAAQSEKVHHALDLAILPDEGLARTVRDVQSLLDRTGTVMLTCASSALGTHLALTMMLGRVAPIGAERLAQALTSGIRDLESSRPAIGIMRVASLARREPDALRALESDTTTGLDALPDGPTRRALVSFLDLYGDRAVREAELSTPRWREDVRPVLKMLRIAIRGESREAETALLKTRAHADAEMQKLLPRLSIVEQTLVRHLVARALKASRLREQMRAWVTRVLGMLRDVFLDAERRLLRIAPDLVDEQRALQAAGSSIASIPAVFFLTLEEVVQALLNGRSDVAPLVRARRAEYARDQGRPDPPGTFMGAPPSVMLPPLGGDLFRGLPASAGVVEGIARVLTSSEQVDQLEPGEVLVVHTTDVGWTPTFLIAAGIVTELGGPLSHAAIVAREFGVPSVVNVTGATRAIKTGDKLRVDGDRGVVERVK